MERFDVAVIGGGINGCGITRDAAGRGHSVLLAEAGDLGGATSSASTKLIHGGLRYLEYWEFRLVAEALAEREVLLKIAPHIIWPLEFVLPHESHLRPAWMIRAGLFLYDHLGGRISLPHARGVALRRDGHGEGLKPEFRRGFSYYDCWVDDARLVVLNARSAAQKGAQILPRTRCVGARRVEGEWQVELEDAQGRRSIRARVLVNAGGPWVQSLLEHEIGVPATGHVRLVKGSHIVVPRIHDRRHAYILQNPDRRIVFMIPYERAFTLIGTTDVPVGSEDVRPQASADEIAYLCEAASRYTAKEIRPSDVIWTYSGVRPLYDDGSANPSAVTRDYHLVVDRGAAGEAPLLSVFGGKITTYRRLAEHALKDLEPWLGSTREWTSSETLPGGNFASEGASNFDALYQRFTVRYAKLPATLMARLVRRHGTLADDVLGDASVEGDLGIAFGGGLYEREVRWMIAHEWAREADDIVWRRTKCGLHMTETERAAFAEWMAR